MSTTYTETAINAADAVEETDDDQMNPVTETMTQEPTMSAATPDQTTVDRSLPGKAPAGANDGSLVPLLSLEDSKRFRTAWTEVQSKFVDEPRPAVEQADALVSEVIKQLLQLFAREHTSLESQWNQGNDVSTEELRQALLRYHSFFNRLTA